MAVDAKTKKIIRQNLADFMDANGLELPAVGLLIDLSLDMLRKVASGTRNLAIDDMTRLAEVFGRRVDDFTNEKPPAPYKPVNIPVFILKTLPGLKIDDDLSAKADAFVADLNREWADRQQKKRKRH